MNYRMKINHKQNLLTFQQYRQLVNNFKQRLTGNEIDPFPVVKFFWSGATWLATELDPDTGNFYGLVDMGHGYPELGEFSAYELCSHGYINRDLYFNPTKTLNEYAKEAQKQGTLVGLD